LVVIGCLVGFLGSGSGLIFWDVAMNTSTASNDSHVRVGAQVPVPEP
jgi:hypothetical protein